MKNKITPGEISSNIPRHVSPERRKYLEEKAKQEKERLEKEKIEIKK
jgi:hypothetical protein